MWRSEGGEPRGAAVAGIALSAVPAERVDPSVGRHDPDAVVVLRDVEVPGSIEGEIAVSTELGRGGGPAVAREPPRPVSGDRRLGAVGLEPPDPSLVRDVEEASGAEVQEHRVVESGADQCLRTCAKRDLVEACSGHVRDEQVAVLLGELEAVRSRDAWAGALDVDSE